MIKSNSAGLSKTVKALGRCMRFSARTTNGMLVYPSLSKAWVEIGRFARCFKRLCHDKKIQQKTTNDAMLVLSQNPMGVRGMGG